MSYMYKNIIISIEGMAYGLTKLLVEVNNDIAERIYKYTKCPKDELDYYFSNNIHPIVIECTDNILIDNVVEKAMEIANNMATEDFYMSMLTNNGMAFLPAEMHKILKVKYGLCGDLEWFVAHIFLSIGKLITDPEFCYKDFEEDFTITVVS